MPTEQTFDRNTLPGIFSGLDRLEVALKVPPHFFEKLLHEEDWTFIVKLHALMEAALTMLLGEQLNTGSQDNPRLTDAVSNLDMSAVRVGKVTLANALGLIREDEARLIRYLSTLRNVFVHQIQNVALRLDAHVASMDKNQRDNFLRVLIRPPLSLDQVTEAVKADILAKPKGMLWVAFCSVMFEILLKIDEIRRQRGKPTHLTVADALPLLKDAITIVGWVQQARKQPGT